MINAALVRISAIHAPPHGVFDLNWQVFWMLSEACIAVMMYSFTGFRSFFLAHAPTIGKSPKNCRYISQKEKSSTRDSFGGAERGPTAKRWKHCPTFRVLHSRGWDRSSTENRPLVVRLRTSWKTARVPEKAGVRVYWNSSYLQDDEHCNLYIHAGIVSYGAE